MLCCKCFYTSFILIVYLKYFILFFSYEWLHVGALDHRSSHVAAVISFQHGNSGDNRALLDR